MEIINIREVKKEELEKINGGNPLLIPVGIGAVTGAITGAANGGGWRGALSGAALGAASGLSGGLAGITTGFVRAGWAVRSVAFGAAGGLAEMNDERREEEGESTQL